MSIYFAIELSLKEISFVLYVCARKLNDTKIVRSRVALRWLTTVFLRLNSATIACKNDASSPKEKRKPLLHLKGVKSLQYT